MVKNIELRNYIFLGGLFPKEKLREIEQNSIGVIQYAANAFQWSIIDGLVKQNIDISIVNLPYVGSYPSLYKKLHIKSDMFEYAPGRKGYNVGFNNLKGYKNFDRFLKARKFLQDNITDKTEVLFVYALHIPFLAAALSAKKRFKGLKICVIIPDLPEFMGDINFYRRILIKCVNKYIKKVLKKFDCFVFLTKQMADYLELKDKPNIVLEGIFNIGDDEQCNEKNPEIVVMYSGTLAMRYGIGLLLEAFKKLKNENYRLWIIGDGDGLKTVEEYSKYDSRIIYYGQLTRKEVLVLQKKASILVNPRTSEGNFTKYSFPSKTMEYLASGTPTILFPLEGIPDEYFKYCFTVDKISAECLKDMIIKVGSLSVEERKTIGLKSREFILNNKNEIVQTRKIINLINVIK